MSERKNKVSGLKSYNKSTKVAQFDCYLPGSRSKRRERTVTCESYQDALKRLAAFKEELRYEVEGVTIAPASMLATVPVTQTVAVPTFAEYVKQWWDASISVKERAGTKKRTTVMLYGHVVPFFGAKVMTAIKSLDVDDFVAHMKAKKKENGEPYSPATINTLITIFRAVMNNAVKREIITNVPKDRDQYQHVPEISNELDDNEWRKFLAAFDDKAGFIALFEKEEMRGSVTPDAAELYYTFFRASQPLFALELSTGLRREDLVNTEWSQIVTFDGEVFLKRVTEKKGTVVFVPLTPEAVRGIEECRKRTVRSPRWVFVQNNGCKPFSVTQLRKYFAKAKLLAGLDGRTLRFHDLRHSVGCRLLSRGYDVTIVRDILGHANVNTTQRYARVSKKARQGIAAALSVEVSTKSLQSKTVDPS